MITFHQALEAACAAVEQSGAGDVVVELKGAEYRTSFAFVTAAERRTDHVVEVAIDAESGKVLKKEDGGSLPALQGYSAADGWQQFLSAKRAYDIALDALKGFREYDERGRLTVQLRNDVYYVTFPAKEAGSRGADFAMQVHVDARTGKVLKLLAAS
jgi:uncharacterized membrane protein YkoI